MKTEIRNALQLTTKSGRTLLHDGCVLEVPVETQDIQLLRHCDFTHVILSACQRAQMLVKIENRCLSNKQSLSTSFSLIPIGVPL